jgi:hypothetical protein
VRAMCATHRRSTMLCRAASPGEKSRAELSTEDRGRLAQLHVAAALTGRSAALTDRLCPVSDGDRVRLSPVVRACGRWP